MAKTPLNEKIDTFFKKCANTTITEKNFATSNINIQETNEYGNLLHAIINYEYDKNRIQELIDILLKKGIDVNYKGRITGMTFIHLALYGYTDKNGHDHSYPEDFILNLIKKAREYGFDVNAKDSDNEDVAISSVASEIYHGSVLKIIEALGPNYQIPKDFLDTYKSYMNDAKKDQNHTWYNRLNQELEAITDYINKSNLNLDEINEKIKIESANLSTSISQLDYEKLTNLYQNIKKIIEEIKALMDKRHIFKVDNSNYENIIVQAKTTIEAVLNRELEIIREKPSQKSLDEIERIASSLGFSNILAIIEELASTYQEYLEKLRSEAASTSTINECHNFLNQITEESITEELKAIVEANIEKLLEAINSAQESELKVKTLGEIASEYVPVSYPRECHDYNDLHIEEIEAITTTNQETIANLKDSITAKVEELYKELYNSITPLVESRLINQEDILSIISKTSNPMLLKENKNERQQ